MDLEKALSMITAVASFGSLGSFVLLLKVRSDNRKTGAETEKIEQEAKDLEFARLAKLLDITTNALTDCQKRLSEATPSPKRNKSGKKGF